MDNLIRKKEIDEKLVDYLYFKRPQLGRFYLLQKIYKRTATENISAFLDFHLKPLVTKVSHILEDTRDFLSRITEIKDLPEDALLVSFDVVGLYPHIPHEKGIEIMKQLLKQRDVNVYGT